MSAHDSVIVLTVVLARLVVPLAIIRYPLPGIVAAMIVDAVDQTIFQTFTTMDLSWYQGYDKALDIYYLAIAYIATLRNWTNLFAFRASRFLFYYRLVGVVLFELSQVRALLLIFPNTFEYFFDFIEAVRVRWDPRRLAPPVIVGAVAFIWIVVKLPQEWWLHIAELDLTDFVKEKIFGVSTTTAWTEAFAARPWVIVLALAAAVGLVVLLWWLITRKLPPADRRPTFDADAEPRRAVDPAALAAARGRLASRLWTRALAEKVLLLALVTAIFGQILPGLHVQPLTYALGVAVFVMANAAVSEWLVRRRGVAATVVSQFAVTLAINIGILAGVTLAIRVLSAGSIEVQHSAFMLLLVTLLITLYDRYRPEFEARFAAERDLHAASAGVTAGRA
jgi:hypothetical protein